ncbi:MAG: hypothetical protein CMD33_08975 [Flavobacteriales bacterium]|nr:hypothetical protein [Flavobacteriales bacterium]
MDQATVPVLFVNPPCCPNCNTLGGTWEKLGGYVNLLICSNCKFVVQYFFRHDEQVVTIQRWFRAVRRKPEIQETRTPTAVVVGVDSHVKKIQSTWRQYHIRKLKRRVDALSLDLESSRRALHESKKHNRKFTKLSKRLDAYEKKREDTEKRREQLVERDGAMRVHIASLRGILTRYVILTRVMAKTSPMQFELLTEDLKADPSIVLERIMEIYMCAKITGKTPSQLKGKASMDEIFKSVYDLAIRVDKPTMDIIREAEKKVQGMDVSYKDLLVTFNGEEDEPYEP